MAGITDYDNAMMEAIWLRMQIELLDRSRWHTRIELANAIFERTEVFDNRQRRHGSLGMLTPTEFEKAIPVALNPRTRLHGSQDTPRCASNPGWFSSRDIHQAHRF